jgi:N-acetylglucosaminyldiphosphoundecaprenol N-acetyl-beta-D-mannosaminyltransferase
MKLLRCNFSNLTKEETIDKIVKSIDQNKKIVYMDINADKVVTIYKDPNMQKYVDEADIVNPDGMAVFWASKFLGKPLKERIAGVDLFVELIKVSAEKGYRIYFLGAKQEVIELMIEKIRREYGDSVIGGYRNGYFSEEDEENICNEINKSNSQLLFLGITSPKKEYFIERNKDKLNVNFIMGVGGSFDVVSGKIKRAPLIMQKLGLEWLFRIYQEPKRLWKRYAKTNPIFIYIVLKERFSKS